VPLGVAVRSPGRRRRATIREPGDLPERSHPSIVRGARMGRTSAAVTNRTVTRMVAAMNSSGLISQNHKSASMAAQGSRNRLRLWLATVATGAVLTLTGSAMAADMAVKAPPRENFRIRKDRILESKFLASLH
jgi:hypothetical protein